MSSCNWNEYNLNHLTSIDWRASLVPAAAVTPAPIAYINVAAVKSSQLNLGEVCNLVRLEGEYRLQLSISGNSVLLCLIARQFQEEETRLEGRGYFGENGLISVFHGITLAMFYLFYFEKIRVFKARRFCLLNIAAWDNRKRQSVLFCWFFKMTIMIEGDGWGGLYCHVRGEILRLWQDKQLRKHSARTYSSIKNESWGIEDDQIPSQSQP